MWAGPWEVYLMRRKSDREAQKPDWEEVPNGDCLGTGRYRFNVRWSNSFELETEIVTIATEEWFEFTPAGILKKDKKDDN